MGPLDASALGGKTSSPYGKESGGGIIYVADRPCREMAAAAGDLLVALTATVKSVTASLSGLPWSLTVNTRRNERP